MGGLFTPTITTGTLPGLQCLEKSFSQILIFRRFKCLSHPLHDLWTYKDISGHSTVFPLVVSGPGGGQPACVSCGFTSIINQPNSAILSVGAIVQKPVVKNNNIVIGNTMKLTLACDHRTVDGATGALFLQTLKEYIENPVTMLM